MRFSFVEPKFLNLNALVINLFAKAGVRTLLFQIYFAVQFSVLYSNGKRYIYNPCSYS
jgi:hypothetical protein